MPANGKDTPRSSVDGLGATDLARVDAHEITAEEYDEIPELTDATMARAVPGHGLALLKRGRGRPKVDRPKQQVTMRLDAGLVAAMRASGPGWQGRANDALRTWLGLSGERPADEAEGLDREAGRAPEAKVDGQAKRDAASGGVRERKARGAKADGTIKRRA